MDIQKELNEWADWFIPHDSKDLRDALELNSFNQLNVEKLLAINGLSEAYAFRAKNSWEAWQAAKAQAVPEGFVLVSKDKISHFYQDNDEPENFCNSSNDLDFLGDGIDKDQIMIVNKHTQADISTEKFYGAWKLIETSYGTRWKFELFKSESEAKQAMIESQEPVNAL